MLFNSYIFILLFLPLTLFGFHLACRHSLRSGKIWLVVASLAFYGWWNPWYLWLIGFSVCANYLVGWHIFRSKRPGRKRALLISGVLGNLLLLGYYKYANFFVDSINAAFGASFFLEHIVLPLAISFFTFTEIVFLLEAAKDRGKYYTFSDYAFFVTFFPHLIAGPIVRHWEIMPQLEGGRLGVRAYDLSVGTTIFILGLGKKILLADTAADYANPVFAAAGAGTEFTSFEAWLGAIAYALQIYFDFSGYSDMAIGLARMFGIVFPINFNSPYKATAIIDFWRRWHITLTRFMTEYLYFPLGGNRCSKLRRTFNVLVTMTVSGFWHGANWTFAFWGFMHGVFISINHGWRDLPVSRRWAARRIWQMAAWFLTMICVLTGWVYFRADNMTAANGMVMKMFNLADFTFPQNLSWLIKVIQKIGLHGTPTSVDPIDYETIPILALLWAIALFFPNNQELMARHKTVLEKVHPHRWLQLTLGYKTAMLFGVLLAVCLLRMNRVMAFLYYQF